MCFQDVECGVEFGGLGAWEARRRTSGASSFVGSELQWCRGRESRGKPERLLMVYNTAHTAAPPLTQRVQISCSSGRRARR